jgi:prepilin-type N-terminal cleavage/methylation domain-containing protein
MTNRERGFSIIEMMVSVAVMTIILGGIFDVVGVISQRTYTEQAKLDMFQEAREFMDQMSRDLHQAGYPNVHNFAMTGVLTASPVTHDALNAVGIVFVSPGDLWLEGDMDGDGSVEVVRYHLDTNPGNGCPCLKRSELPKVTGNPMDGQTLEVYQVEVQGVQNADIFSAFGRGTTGTPIDLPADFSDNGVIVATVDTIKVTLSLRSPLMDPKNKQHPVTTLVATSKLNNCSQAASGFAMSCQ